MSTPSPQIVEAVHFTSLAEEHILCVQPTELIAAFETAKTPNAKQALLFGVRDATATLLTRDAEFRHTNIRDFGELHTGLAGFGPTRDLLHMALVEGYVAGSRKLLEEQPIGKFARLAIHTAMTPTWATLVDPLWHANNRALKMIEATEPPESERHETVGKVIHSLRMALVNNHRV